MIKISKNCQKHEIKNNNSKELTVLNPLYMILISCLVNLVSLQRSSRATGTGLGTLDGSISKTTSSIGLSDGVAMSSFYSSSNSGRHMLAFYRNRTKTNLSSAAFEFIPVHLY